MSDENEDKTPEGLDDFLGKIFGNSNNAEEFAASLEDPATELWASMYTMYRGMLAGGFPAHIANDIMAGYIFRVVMAIGENPEND